MKRIFKVLIIILIICLSFKVKAKELIIEELELNNNESLHNTGAAYTSSDGGVVYSGMSAIRSTAVYGSYDMVFIKFDEKGNRVFDKAFGGDGKEYSNAIKPTSDGGYISVGFGEATSINEGPYNDAIIVKLDKNGNVEWYSNYYVSDYYNEFSDIIELKDGNYIAVGITNEYYENQRKHPIVVKYDKNGEKLWKKEFEGYGYDEFLKVVQLKDGNIVVVGRSEYNTIDHESYNMRASYDLDGNLLYSDLGDDSFHIYNNIYSTSDGGYILFELEKASEDYKYYSWYSKYDKNHNLVWKNKFRESYDTSKIAFVEHNDYYIFLGRNNTEATILNSNLLLINKETGEVIKKTDVSKDFGSILSTHLSKDETIRCYSYYTETDSEGYPVIFDLYYKYDIIPKKTEKGTFTVDKTVAKNKEIVTINAKPKLGYVVDKIILTDSKGNKTELHELTFEMIDDDVEIEVLFKELINPQTGFSIISIMSILGFLIFITIKSKKKTLTN